MEFNRKGENFILEHIHDDSYRVIHRPTRTWSIVEGAAALLEAEALIDILWKSGDPNLFPKKGDKFVVLYEDGLEFDTGTHHMNPQGTGKVTAKKGDILTFSREGEDYGWYYLDGGKVRHPQYYFEYADGSKREAAKGSKPWQYIWRRYIKKITT